MGKMKETLHKDMSNVSHDLGAWLSHGDVHYDYEVYPLTIPSHVNVAEVG